MGFSLPIITKILVVALFCWFHWSSKVVWDEIFVNYFLLGHMKMWIGLMWSLWDTLFLGRDLCEILLFIRPHENVNTNWSINVKFLNHSLWGPQEKVHCIKEIFVNYCLLGQMNMFTELMRSIWIIDC